MFYSLEQQNHGLKLNPLKSCVVPRPIAWVSTISAKKTVNIAPFSYFNLIADYPAMVMISCVNHPRTKQDKDTLRNIKANHQLVINMVSSQLAEQMNLTSASLDYEISEAEFAKLELTKSQMVEPPRIASSPIALECTLHEIISLPAIPPVIANNLILAKIVGIYIDDQYIIDGKIDIENIEPVARLGYHDYATIKNIFSMPPPKI